MHGTLMEAMCIGGEKLLCCCENKSTTYRGCEVAGNSMFIHHEISLIC